MTVAVSAIPAALDALVSLASAALGTVNVFDGVGLTENPGDYLMIGVDDPDTDGMPSAASGSAEWQGLGAKTRMETFTVRCVAYSVDGNAVMKTARDAAMATVAAVERAIVANPTLSSSVLYATFAGVDALMQDQTDMGAEASVLFGVNCRARLTA